MHYVYMDHVGTCSVESQVECICPQYVRMANQVQRSTARPVLRLVFVPSPICRALEIVFRPSVRLFSRPPPLSLSHQRQEKPLFRLLCYYAAGPLRVYFAHCKNKLDFFLNISVGKKRGLFN